MSHVARNDDDVKLNRLKMSIVKFIWARKQEKKRIRWETRDTGTRGARKKIADELNRFGWCYGLFALERAHAFITIIFIFASSNCLSASHSHWKMSFSPLGIRGPGAE